MLLYRVVATCFRLLSNRYKSGGESKNLEMTSVEELQGIVAGLMAIVKQQAEAQKATNAQIANLTEALLAHGGPPAAPPIVQANSPALRMPALQLPQFRYDQNTHDDVNEFLESFDVQTTHLQAVTKLTLLQRAWPNGRIPCCQWKRLNLQMKQHLSKSWTVLNKL